MMHLHFCINSWNRGGNMNMNAAASFFAFMMSFYSNQFVLNAPDNKSVVGLISERMAPHHVIITAYVQI